MPVTQTGGDQLHPCDYRAHSGMDVSETQWVDGMLASVSFSISVDPRDVEVITDADYKIPEITSTDGCIHPRGCA